MDSGGTQGLSAVSQLNCLAMTDDWLLVETLGREPAVVAVGRELQDLVPITAFLKRATGRAAIQIADQLAHLALH